MREIWKDVVGFENLYQVSNLGRVKTLGNGRARNPKLCVEKVLKQGKSTRGYPQVCFIGKKTIVVHRLVAIAFIPNPENKPQINHKDGNKINNVASNLEWCTSSENNKHRYATGLHVQAKGKTDNQSKPILQMDLQGNIIREWASQNEARREMGYKQGSISECCSNKRRTANGFKWQFK